MKVGFYTVKGVNTRQETVLYCRVRQECSGALNVCIRVRYVNLNHPNVCSKIHFKDFLTRKTNVAILFPNTCFCPLIAIASVCARERVYLSVVFRKEFTYLCPLICLRV